MIVWSVWYYGIELRYHQVKPTCEKHLGTTSPAPKQNRCLNCLHTCAAIVAWLTGSRTCACTYDKSCTCECGRRVIRWTSKLRRWFDDCCRQYSWSSSCYWTHYIDNRDYNWIFYTRGYRDSFYQHTDARYWYSNSICLSVCPSVYLSVRHVLVLNGNGLTYCHCFFTIR